MLLLKCQLASDMGCLRTNNEDMILFNGGLYRDERYEQKFELAPQARFTAFVADGMGGHEGGNLPVNWLPKPSIGLLPTSLPGFLMKRFLVK